MTSSLLWPSYETPDDLAAVLGTVAGVGALPVIDVGKPYEDELAHFAISVRVEVASWQSLW